MRQAVKDDEVPIDRGAAGHDAEQRDFAAVKHVRQNVGESFGIAGHLQTDIEAFSHAELLHRVGNFSVRTSSARVGAHFAREIETIRIDVGDDDVARAGMFADRNGHATDRSRAGDEHIFADQIEGERGVHGVAERIETGKHIERDRRIGVPAVVLRDRDKFGPGAGAIDADALGVRAKVTAPGQTIAAMPAGDMSLADDEIASRKSAHVSTDRSTTPTNSWPMVIGTGIVFCAHASQL